MSRNIMINVLPVGIYYFYPLFQVKVTVLIVIDVINYTNIVSSNDQINFRKY